MMLLYITFYRVVSQAGKSACFYVRHNYKILPANLYI